MILALVCRHRLRSAADAHARLVQATVLLYAGPLARELGIDCSGPLSEQYGDQLTDLLACPLPPPVTQADATPPSRE